ncbi:MAG: hypothetical protein EA351_02040 [Gemmatimonadales bacterium]|nr:MAG: hypothetical protein EA351_02040 [Gemmatimonadales bacterium]
MRVQTVARKCDVPAPVLTRATEQLQKLSRFDPSLQSAEIIFEAEGHRKSVEAILTREGATPAVARGQDTEFRPALDQMLERMRRILTRGRSQVTDHRGPRIAELVDPEPRSEASLE